MQKISSAAFADTKPHYELLDGLRGVAALLVIWYHVLQQVPSTNDSIMGIWLSTFSLFYQDLLSVMLMTTAGKHP